MASQCLSSRARQGTVRQVLALLACACLWTTARAQSILTVAGGGTDDRQPAILAALARPSGVAIDAAGNLYIADSDNSRVRIVDAATQIITTIAGSGFTGFSGDGGPATAAELSLPRGVAIDAAGNLYIADTENHRIRKVDIATSIITTVAGTGVQGSSGDDGLATAAALNRPFGITLDRSGNLYIADTFNHKIRRVDARTKIITTVAGTGTRSFSGEGGPATAAALREPRGVAFDASGNLHIADTDNHRIRRVDVATNIITTIAGSAARGYSGDGGPATEAALRAPTGIAIDNSGNIYFADTDNHRVRRVDAQTKIITTVAGGSTAGFSGDGGLAAAATLNEPRGVAIDASGNLYIGDRVNNRIRKVDAATKIITTVAGSGGEGFSGDGGPAAAAVLRFPRGVAVDESRNLYIADTDGHRVRRTDAQTRIITSVAGSGLEGFSGDGGPATAATLREPHGLAVDAFGNVYIADTNNHRIRKVDRETTVITTVAGSGVAGSSGDGGPATAATLRFPRGVTIDGSGNIYIADTENHSIRRVDAVTQVITTIAGTGTEGDSGDNGPATAAAIRFPRGVAVDSRNVYIADTGNNRIRKVDIQANVITTVAGSGALGFSGDGGAATAAALSAPYGIAADGSGNLVLVDSDNNRVRKVDARTNVITTIAGSATRGFSGDGGPANAAALLQPRGVATDAGGNVYIADRSNSRIRAVFACVQVEPPALSTPADGAAGLSSAPTLTWSRAPGAFRYDVLLDTISSPARVIASDLTQESFMPSNLQPGTKYFWSVVAKGDPFCPTVSRAASAISSFTTAAGCGTGSFDLIEPPDAATGSISRLAWQAAPGAGAYDLYLGNSTPPPLFEAGLTMTTHAVPNIPGRIFWFIVAHAACDPTKTSTSPVRSYTALAAPLCGTNPNITLVSPAPGSTNVATTVDLTWSVSQITAPVDVYFGTTSTPPLLRSGIPATASLTLPPLDPGVTYYWRVVADCASPLSTPVASFTTQTACAAPQGTQIIFAPNAVSTGATYSIVWSTAPGLDVDGGYLVERSTSPSFGTIVDSQVTSSSAASFIAGAPGTVYHRVRGVPACDPNKRGPTSEVKSVNITNAPSNIIFTVQPAPVVTSLGERIEDHRGTFTLENIGATPAQIIVGQSEFPGSRPFFSIAEGGAFITLQPRVPRTLTIQYSGPPNNASGSYQGVIFAVGVTQPLAVTPYAFVNLKVGGEPGVAPQFVADGTPSDYVAFPGFSGDDDSNRPGREISIRNPGTAPMDLAAEVGPDVWLVPENRWNSQPLAGGATRTFKLFTRRPFAPNGSPLPRYTYFTVRTKDGASARLLVQDNDRVTVSSGRATALDVSTRSFIVPEAVSQTTGGGRAVTRLRLTNGGGDSVQLELVFTPTGADGFDANAVKRAVVIVPPNDVVALTDPLVQIFGASDGATGQIEVRIPHERLGLIITTASTVFLGGGSTAIIPTVARIEGARLAVPHVIYLPPAPEATTNLTIAETSGLDRATVRVVADNGQMITQDVARYGMKRFSVPTASRLEMHVDSGGGSIIGLATITSGTSNATVLSRPLAERVSATALARAFFKRTPEATVPSVTTVVPVISGSSSAGNAPLYKTAVGFVAQSAQAVFTATFYPSGGGVALNRSVTIAAGQTTVYNDVLGNLFAVSTPSDGNLFLQGPPNGKVYAVLRQTTSGGTTALASSMPLPTTVSEALTSATSAAQRPLSLDGFEQSVDPTRGTRWMLLLNEVGGASGFVNVRMYEAGNRSRPIAEKDLQVFANQQIKLDTVFGALGLDAPDRRKDRTNVQVVVTATAGNARVAASAVSIDNRTGDTKMFALAPVVGSGNPKVSFVAPVVVPQVPPSPRRRGVRH